MELQASAIEGCHLCSLIETEISDDHMEKLHQHFDESLSVFEKLEAHIWINETGGPRLGLSMPWREPMVLNKEPIVDLEYELVASDIHARK